MSNKKKSIEDKTKILRNLYQNEGRWDYEVWGFDEKMSNTIGDLIDEILIDAAKKGV
jgi:hypothetical protein